MKPVKLFKVKKMKGHFSSNSPILKPVSKIVVIR